MSCEDSATGNGSLLTKEGRRGTPIYCNARRRLLTLPKKESVSKATPQIRIKAI